ncbi:Protein K03A11.4 [Aphelenchoides avenae]|nr:Protein K03A11.4 [Aphelenchus avenae]
MEVPADGDDQEFCKNVLDEQPFIGFEFERRGYKTMIAEDWAMGAWNWPDCKGFTRPPADHYMRPFMFVYESTYHWRHKLVRAQCRGFHLYLLDYLKQFIDVYEHKPKLSITWLDLAHDTPNGLYPFDDVFLQFLKEYKAKLNNAFFYLMGDHGLRHGGIRATKQGELEDNNPAMVLVVPEHLRRNQNLMSNLKANSKQLVTHYDTYATLVNIARHFIYFQEGDRMSSDSQFYGFKTAVWNMTLHGENYLYPFNLSVPRTCENQRVPFEFCICDNKAQEPGEWLPSWFVTSTISFDRRMR